MKNFFVLNLLLMIVCITCRPINVNDNKDEDSMDGKYLFKLGKAANEPLLQLIGTVLTNTERNVKSSVRSETRLIRDYMCRAHQCSEWSNWSRCSSQRLYGVSKRNRVCGIASVLCPTAVTAPTTEKETKLCKGWCPENYTITDNGFCLNYYNINMTYDDATSLCQEDGGSVVNMSSLLKVKDSHSLIIGLGSFEYYWINGQMTSYSEREVTGFSKSEVLDYSKGYTTGSSDLNETFEFEDPFDWFSDDPKAYQSCKIDCSDIPSTGKTRLLEWTSVKCNALYSVVCEMEQGV